MTYDQVKEKGIENYISVLKQNNLFDDILERIKKKNVEDPETVVRRIFENQKTFFEYLFSDLYFGFDSFYEDFDHHLKKILETCFEGTEVSFEIHSIYIDRNTKELKGKLLCFPKGGYTAEDIQKINEWMPYCDPFMKISIQKRDTKHEFDWIGFELSNLPNLLNFLNEFCEDAGFSSKWFPIASSYGDNFIFTTPEKYQAILQNHLMPPSGYQVNEEEVIFYPKGIKTGQKEKEILPNSNIFCEVPVGLPEYVMYVKLWRKSKEGILDISLIPDAILSKLKTIANVCNRMKWNYGKIIADPNMVLNSEELEQVTKTFFEKLQIAVEQEEIDISGQE
ncbi:MAG: hypothetical protein R2879_07695 [Saprospiraceae bacterium]